MPSAKKVIVVAALPDSLINFRGHLLRAMVERGHDVLACAAKEDVLAGSVNDSVVATLKEWGVRYHPIPLARTGMSPKQDFKTLGALRSLFVREKPDVVLTYTMKPVIYGGLAGRLSKVPSRFALITGLSYGLRDEADAASKKGKIVQALYRAALKGAKAVIFQNPDDRAMFGKFSLVQGTTSSEIVNGSGVDTAHFMAMPLPTGPISFLTIGRIIKEKGIYDFVEAARLLKQRGVDASFKIVGPFDNHPLAITQLEMDGWVVEWLVEYLGSTKDVRPYLADCSVFVLPSYREGTPRTVLEAMSVGRPIITTDAPGCKETTIEGENGFLVPVANPARLAETMQKFIEQPELIAQYGAKSRQIAEQKYDVHKVNERMLEVMGL